MDGEEKIRKAVALRFEQAKDKVPRVVASGKGLMAEKILQVASEAKVPVHEDQTLVEMLSYLDIGSEIPEELYKMVAEVMVFIYNLDKKAKKQAKNL